MGNSKLINLNERIFVAGSNGMVGSSVCRLLRSSGYGKKEHGGVILAPSKKELKQYSLSLFRYNGNNSKDP